MIKQAPFKPTDIGGCQLWLDGADPAGTGQPPTNGSTVSTWADKSGNGRNATGGVSPTYNTSQRAIVFNGSSWLSTSYSSVPANETAFIVYQTTSTAIANNCFMIGPTNIGGRLILSVNENDGFGLSFKIGSYGVANGSRIVQNQNQMYLGTTTVASTTSFVYLNGTQGPSSTLTYSGTGTTQIGTAVSGSAIYIGFIYEIVIYNITLTTSQRQQVESYLAQKWGLRQQLPQGHPGTRGIVFPSQPIPTAIYWRYPSPFVPSVAGTVSMWLDGTDPAGTGIKPSNGATVSTWVDKSGSGINLTAVGTPTYTLSNSSVYLDGSSYLQNTNFSFTNHTIFFVSNQILNGPLYTNTTITDTTGFYPNHPGVTYYLVKSDSSWLTSTSPFANGTTYIYSIQYDSLNNINLWSNGSISPVITGTAGTITRNMFILGRRNVSGFQGTMIGNVFEVIQYNSDLGQTARQQVEGYLAWKWGLQTSLPPTHPYKNSSPSTTNPAGISRPANVLPIPSIVCTPIRTYFLVTGGLVFHVDAGNPASYPGSGSTWFDLTTSGLNVTLYSSPTYSSANGGYIAFTPSSSQYGGTTLSYNTALTRWTTEAWHYFTNVTVGNLSAIICKTFAGDVNFALGSPVGGASGKNLAAAYYAGTWYHTSSSYTLPSVGWYHLVGTYDGTNLRLYVNNVLTQTQASSQTPGLGGGLIHLMRRWDTGDYWGGYLAIARVYNRALSADEINTNYQLSKARFGLS
jgi:hypothetical protein